MLIGDSARGNLALGLLQRCKRVGLPRMLAADPEVWPLHGDRSGLPPLRCAPSGTALERSSWNLPARLRP